MSYLIIALFSIAVALSVATVVVTAMAKRRLRRATRELEL